MYHNLRHVTLTGVDNSTNLDELVRISEMCPKVEWGILYSPKRQGRGGRYPAIDTINVLLKHLPHSIPLALHICGVGVPNLFRRGPEVTGLVEQVAERQGRIQLNFNQLNDSYSIDDLQDVLERFPLQVITQHNYANQDVWVGLKEFPNYAALFDSSGGMGLERTTWPVPLEGVFCGYAGGLGPDNLATKLFHIQELVGSKPYWIDMEGKLRNQSDEFDLARAESCAKLFIKETP